MTAHKIKAVSIPKDIFYNSILFIIHFRFRLEMFRLRKVHFMSPHCRTFTTCLRPREPTRHSCNRG
jgi:hypothetical protein